jgi:hypothetical protein
MRPVSEGLALFAEHDQTIGFSRIISRPSLLAGIMFAGRQSDPQEYLRLAPMLIGTARLRPSNIRRKANLLLQPFSTATDGYLAGYLYLRLLYRIAAQRCSAHGDSDFFAHSLRCWLYDDWDLVRLLLDDSCDYEKSIERMVRYCQERAAGFIELSDEQLAGFEQRGVAADADLFEHRGPCLGLKFYSHPVLANGDSSAGKRKLDSLLTELFHEEPKHRVLKGVFRSDLDLLGLRSTITLGHASFGATVTSGRMLHLRTEGSDFPVFATGAPDNLSPGWNATVDVDLLLANSPPGAYQLISDATGLIASQSFGQNPEVPAYLQTTMANWEKRHQKMEVEDQAIDQVLADSSEEAILQVTTDRVKRTRKEVFELKGLSLTPDNLIQIAQQLLARDGFLTVLSESPQLVIDAAAISLCASLRVRASESLPQWNWFCGNELQTADHINECFLRSLGFKPFLRTEQEVVFSMI